MEHFNIEHVPFESANGGSAVVYQKTINYKLRPDFMICKKREIESVFIEIMNKGFKNVVLGCIYRHRCMQHSEFND